MNGKTLQDRLKILVVDDEPDIRDSLCAHLKKTGFDADGAQDAAAARSRLAVGDIDLVVLDIMMSGENGLSLCRHLRETDNTPVILLTALADDTDRIVGLEIGADDYLAKPFNPRELVARIRAVLRRVTEQEGSSHGHSHSGLTEFAGWRIDEAQSELKRHDGLIVALSSREFTLLKVFLDHPGEVLSRDELMSLSRGRATHPFERSIDNMIARLRRKIEVNPRDPRILKTVWGGGYKLVTKAAEA